VSHIWKQICAVARLQPDEELFASQIYKSHYNIMNNQNKSPKVEATNITLSALIGWLFGGFFLLAAVISITSNPLHVIFLLAISAITFPPFTNLIESKLKFSLSRSLTIICVLVILGLFASVLKEEKDMNTKTVTEQAIIPTQSTDNIISNITTTPSKTVTKEVTPTTVKVEEKKVVQTSTTKSYQQVFTFSGNGIKKSEPFTITGDRFKIKYDCSGSYCGATLYKNGSFKDLIMNVAGSTKDETIIYGKGEYYIDANTMGSYTMIVEDYK